MTSELNIASYSFKQAAAKHLGNHLMRLGQPKILHTPLDGDENQRFAAFTFGYDSGYRTAWMLHFPNTVSQIITHTGYQLLEPSDVHFIDRVSPTKVDFGITCSAKDITKSPAVIEMLREFVGIANYLIDTTDAIEAHLKKNGRGDAYKFVNQISLDASLIGRESYYTA